MHVNGRKPQYSFNLSMTVFIVYLVKDIFEYGTLVHNLFRIWINYLDQYRKTVH